MKFILHSIQPKVTESVCNSSSTGSSLSVASKQKDLFVIKLEQNIFTMQKNVHSENGFLNFARQLDVNKSLIW